MSLSDGFLLLVVALLLGGSLLLNGLLLFSLLSLWNRVLFPEHYRDLAPDINLHAGTFEDPDDEEDEDDGGENSL